MTLKAATLLFVAVLFLPATTSYGEERSLWPIEPSLTAGYVYEFTRYARPSAGAGLSVRCAPGSWTMLGRYRTDFYAMTYFGIMNQTVQQVFSGKVLPGDSFLTRIDVAERKSEEELMAGRRISGDGFALLVGFRRQTLANSFSSMRSTGPSARAEGRLEFSAGVISWWLDGSHLSHTRVNNHRLGPSEYAYALPDGERTISYFGEPRYAAGWGLGLGAGNRFSAGYEGGFLSLKYGYRHYQGIWARGAF